jgi:hypothetical protein
MAVALNPGRHAISASGIAIREQAASSGYRASTSCRVAAEHSLETSDVNAFALKTLENLNFADPRDV